MTVNKEGVYKMFKVIRFKLTRLLKDLEDVKGRVRYRALAKEIGISHVALWKMANNEPYNPSLEMLDKLCAYFKCAPGDLLEYKKGK